MKKTKLFSLLFLMFWCTIAVAQDIKITGVVLDTNSEPVIGASVLEKVQPMVL